MRLLTGRNHPNFNLDGGLPQGIKTVIRAAKDPIARVPQDEEIIALLQRTLCRAKLGELGCWEVTSVTGMEIAIPYSAPFSEWKKECENLLAEAMKDDT